MNELHIMQTDDRGERFYITKGVDGINLTKAEMKELVKLINAKLAK